MLKINPSQRFDLNILGVVIIILMIVFGFFYTIEWVKFLIYILILICFACYLVYQIYKNKNVSIMISNEGLWFILYNDDSYAVELRDYWIQTNKIFIWLKGSNKSISFMVSRSIIGAKSFSQLRTKIT
jgi:Ca2+/Na+ antiporter